MVIQIGIAAYSRTPPQRARDKVTTFIEEFVKMCGKHINDIVFLVGGYEGLMKIFVDEILAKKFNVIIIPPIEQENQVYPSRAIVIRTGTTFVIRSSILVHSSDILLALGGGVGTLEEVVTAHNEGKTVFMLVDVDLPTDIVKMLPNKIDPRSLNPLKTYSDPSLLAKDLCTEIESRLTRKLVI